MIFVTHMEITPNPNALKYMMNESILEKGICQYNNPKDAKDELSKALFDFEGVIGVFYKENFITVTKDASVDWIDIETIVKDEINARIETVEMTPQEITPVDHGEMTEMIQKIEEILDETIRPGLGMDGGGLDVIELSDDMQLTVLYQGACGSCPSSTTGTLYAIENILQEQFDPRITVISMPQPDQNWY